MNGTMKANRKPRFRTTLSQTAKDTELLTVSRVLQGPRTMFPFCSYLRTRLSSHHAVRYPAPPAFRCAARPANAPHRVTCPNSPPQLHHPPVTPIGELKSWRLLVQCSRCRRKVVLMLDALAQRHGPGCGSGRRWPAYAVTSATMVNLAAARRAGSCWPRSGCMAKARERCGRLWCRSE